MDEAIKSGLMVVSMRAIGQMIRQMEEVDLYMLMEIFMMDFGKMTKPTDMDNILTRMELNTREIG